MKIQGTVKWFNQLRGFGFIAPDDGSIDMFFYCADVKNYHIYEDDSIKDSKRVSYEKSTDKMCKNTAINVEVIQ